ncbi:hypothetical protein [Streptomyces aureocirculatus]|uniref:hypothetical protein n=1 Tax=Streptomyces aureocirculatus TaxID=67275 RepID=UPI000B0BA6F2|nr:hypothetical protein [Streptomyces aureocirculatus]
MEPPPHARDKSPEQGLTEIARLANALCEHLTDNQWQLSARIRQLAEATLPHAGEH